METENLIKEMYGEVEYLSAEQVLALVKRLSYEMGFVQGYLADEAGISRSYWNDVVMRGKSIGPQIAEALGLEKRVVYMVRQNGNWE